MSRLHERVQEICDSGSFDSAKHSKSEMALAASGKQRELILLYLKRLMIFDPYRTLDEAKTAERTAAFLRTEVARLTPGGHGRRVFRAKDVAA